VNRPFQLNKRAQLFISMNNEAPSVAAVHVDNPDRSIEAVCQKTPPHVNRDSGQNPR
jgi:hypothetical protein